MGIHDLRSILKLFTNTHTQLIRWTQISKSSRFRILLKPSQWVCSTFKFLSILTNWYESSNTVRVTMCIVECIVQCANSDHCGKLSNTDTSCTPTSLTLFALLPEVCKLWAMCKYWHFLHSSQNCAKSELCTKLCQILTLVALLPEVCKLWALPLVSVQTVLSLS